jgi:hypothetical protein
VGSAADNHDQRERAARRADPEYGKTDRELLTELADRARRTETRVTKIANHLGVDAGGEKPRLRGNVLHVPSLKTSLEDIVAAIGSHSGPVSVHCGDDYLATVGV